MINVGRDERPCLREDGRRVLKAGHRGQRCICPENRSSEVGQCLCPYPPVQLRVDRTRPMVPALMEADLTDVELREGSCLRVAGSAARSRRRANSFCVQHMQSRRSRMFFAHSGLMPSLMYRAHLRVAGWRFSWNVLKQWPTIATPSGATIGCLTL